VGWKCTWYKTSKEKKIKLILTNQNVFQALDEFRAKIKLGNYNELAWSLNVISNVLKWNNTIHDFFYWLGTVTFVMAF
jgi:hypothetical protein